MIQFICSIHYMFVLFVVNWVDVGKTLREQGIDESEEVLLRRKFFFSDQNIDSRDPVQLNLLYVQARDAILDGTHPVTQDKGKLLLLFGYRATLRIITAILRVSVLFGGRDNSLVA